MAMMEYKSGNPYGVKTKFGIVGSGWRTEFFIRTAVALPDWFEICGLVTRSDIKGAEIEKQWGFKTYRSVDELLKHTNPDFMVVSVAVDIAPDIISELADREIAVLSETSPASDLEGMISLNKRIRRGARIQVAEQYHLLPQHAANITLARSGKLGDISQAQISFTQGNHAVSLIRKYLNIMFEDVTINGFEFLFPTVEGVGRKGLSEAENVIEAPQVIALLDFGGKLGVFDFAKDQHRSWHRFLRTLIRGERGEISNFEIRYLKDFKTPVEMTMKRVSAGESGNLEGYHLKGILAGDDWVYTNPFIPARLADDEIAVGSCLAKMGEYARGGSSFYSLSEALQDHYISIMIDKAAKTGEKVKTTKQPWAY